MKNRLIILSLAVTTAMALIWYSKPLGHFIDQNLGFTADVAPHKAPVIIGSVELVRGKAYIQRQKITQHLNSNEAQKKYPLYHLDKIGIEPQSSAQIRLNAGQEFLLESSSIAIFELWDSTKDKSPVIMNLLQGQWIPQNPGTPSKFYIAYNKKLENRSKAIGLGPIRILSISPTASQKNFANNEIQFRKPKETQNPQEVKTVTETSTLKDKDIDSVLTKNFKSLQNCQTNAIRLKEPSTGKLIVELTIYASGKVHTAEIQDSTISNKRLQRCIKETFLRTRFKPFKGSPVTKSFPLVFE